VGAFQGYETVALLLSADRRPSGLENAISTLTSPYEKKNLGLWAEAIALREELHRSRCL